MLTLAVLCGKCRNCKYVKTCDFKEMEEVGFLPVQDEILKNVAMMGLDMASGPDKTGMMTPFEYAKRFAQNHGMPLFEAENHPMVDAYCQAYMVMNSFSSPSIIMHQICNPMPSTVNASINQHSETPLDQRFISEMKISTEVLERTVKSTNLQLELYKQLMRNGG